MKKGPRFEDILDRAIKSRLENQRGPQPARVVLYNPATQLADVDPLLSVYIDGELVDPPTLRGVPVQWPRGGGGALTFPLVAGDVVYIIPAEVDLGPWEASEAAGAPTPRRFSLSDVVAIPGVSSRVQPLPATAYDPTAAVLSAAQVKLGSSAAVNPVALSITNDDNWARFAVWAATVEGLLAGLGLVVVPNWATSGGSKPTASTKVKAE
ncbi:MAG: hypothetical protein COW42_13940 [Deltaproteobacteria bacterium CG17_big_fil_post_rev_8_21_14_2_50_63_7]|nr:MAG: hypothetical protein COW42_13940 [Deltaproteobacteria bacterium CG17_big_fil_post_rev_8_21_14_2_50_63_7]